MGARGPDTHSVAHRYAIFLCSLDDSDSAQCVLCQVRCHCIFYGPGIRYSQSGTFGGSNILEPGSNILEPQNFIFNILEGNEEKKL